MPPRLLVLPLAALLACTLRPVPSDSATDTAEPDGSSGGTTTGASASAATTDTPEPTSTTLPLPGTSPGTTVDPSAGTTDDTGQTFVRPTDVPGANDCNGFDMPEQDCPEGQKCTIEGTVSDTHCVDIVDDPQQMYEPCTILQGDAMSGHDDCDAGLVCWNVDPDTGIGLCIGFCQGPAEGPLTCADPKSSCTLCQDCVVGLCLPGCDPIAQDCPADQLCVPHPQDSSFVCVIDASGEEGQLFDACEFANTCDPGLICVGPEFAQECDPMTAGCCLPFCNLDNFECPGVGQDCLPWFEEGQAPDGLEHIGLCGLPKP